MSTLDRYILNAFSRNLALVLLVLVSLYSLVEFLENVDDFIEHQAELRYYLLYPVYHLPVIIANTLPMAVLLATFTTIGAFSRSNQLTAMLCGGISFSRLSRSLFLGSLILVLFLIIANLWLVPWSSRESNYIKRTEIKGKASQEVSSEDLYFREGNSIISINHAFPARGIVLGITIVEFNDKFMPVKRVQAEKAEHVNNNQWQLKDAVTWSFIPETRALASFDRQSELLIDLKRRPSEMLRLWERPEDMTIDDLLSFTEKLKKEGYDPKAYQVEAHMRFARAVVPVIMVLVGIPFALQRGRNASFSLGIVISLIIFVVYFILYAVFAVFGTIAVLPPAIAAWAANILMALLGTWFFLRVQA
ncbi:MAG: LPS export ABC transporter permease LptG [Desulfuromonadales bacterium]|nr:LPS export ABC transporter permease LptG [Desulfuromonadales bacterium]